PRPSPRRWPARSSTLVPARGVGKHLPTPSREGLIARAVVPTMHAAVRGFARTHRGVTFPTRPPGARDRPTTAIGRMVDRARVARSALRSRPPAIRYGVALGLAAAVSTSVIAVRPLW